MTAATIILALIIHTLGFLDLLCSRRRVRGTATQTHGTESVARVSRTFDETPASCRLGARQWMPRLATPFCYYWSLNMSSA
jgi:hypothetical protein